MLIFYVPVPVSEHAKPLPGIMLYINFSFFFNWFQDNYFRSSDTNVEQNPVRAGVVKSPGDYSWSSYQSQVSLEGGGLIDRQENPIFTLIGRDG